jgi:hypothetical protein
VASYHNSLAVIWLVVNRKIGDMFLISAPISFGEKLIDETL